MSHLPKVLSALSRLLAYPGEHTSRTVELLYVVLQGEIPAAAGSAAKFGAFVDQHDLNQVQETYTGTFDVNPACALEVGWHLFGEEYARGMFLVRMRQEMRKYGVAESVELPDHIVHVLAVVAAMPDDEATRFVRACVQPAVASMRQSLRKSQSPYGHVVDSLADVLAARWGDCDGAESPDVLRSGAPADDPLRAFPAAAVGCGGSCGDSCGGEIDVVPLDGIPSSNRAPDNSSPAVLARKS